MCPRASKTLSGECILGLEEGNVCMCVFAKTQNREARSGTGRAPGSLPAQTLGGSPGKHSRNPLHRRHALKLQVGVMMVTNA